MYECNILVRTRSKSIVTSRASVTLLASLPAVVAVLYGEHSKADQTRFKARRRGGRPDSAGKVSTKRLFCSCGPIPGPCQGTLAAWCFPGAEHRSLPSLALPQQLPALGLTHTHIHILRGSSSAFLPTHSVSNPANLKTLFPESDTTKPPFGEGFFSFAIFSFFPSFP
ncbi:hypothetical protein ROHU_036396 [Labeo rohita]|uniref:Uncharacterized protein n=1 Tax=Labeo rohita TaxID=84645 RepID=A0A498N4C7_LABRO|nr:hypothetical protein ROHU_036396 [Labeo rohita]